MTFDVTVPKKLKCIQQWFAGIITVPIDKDNKIRPHAPSGRAIVEEALEYIAPSPTLEAFQRIELYNQQYWWRLLSNMQESFPTVLRLFGYYDFNRVISFPYLQKYPPNHWSLSYLGQHLVQWIEEEYQASDKALVLDCARLDYAYLDCFIIEQKPCILADESQENGFESSKKMALQPHVRLFCFPYDLLQFRIDFLQQAPDYWIDHEFPVLDPLPEKTYCVVYRDFRNNQVVSYRIEESEFRALSCFQSNFSIDDLCEWLETQPADSLLYQKAQQELHLWVQRWIALQWLYIV